MLQTKFVSGSRDHVEWLRQRLRELKSLSGFIQRSGGGKSSYGGSVYALVYNKRASMTLLSRLFADPAAPYLLRKRRIWEDFCRRNGISTSGSPTPASGSAT